jgi:hypothetical protein
MGLRHDEDPGIRRSGSISDPACGKSPAAYENNNIAGRKMIKINDWERWIDLTAGEAPPRVRAAV